MKILAVGFAGEIIENGVKIAGISASYQHSPINPIHDYFIAEVFTNAGQTHWKEAIVPKTSTFLREEGMIISFVKQLSLSTNPVISHSIETFLLVASQSNNHAYVTRDFISNIVTARIWQSGTHLYNEQNFSIGLPLLAIGQQLGL